MKHKRHQNLSVARRKDLLLGPNPTNLVVGINCGARKTTRMSFVRIDDAKQQTQLF